MDGMLHAGTQRSQSTQGHKGFIIGLMVGPDLTLVKNRQFVNFILSNVFPMKKYLILLMLGSVVDIAWSQLSGKVSLPYAGVEFTIPEGWVGQETDAGYILGSQTEAGAIFLTSHQMTSLASLKEEAMKGFHDNEGTQLMMESAPEALTERSIGGVYTGMLQGQRVKAYAVGLINPHGNGVTILSVTTPELFTERHPQLAQGIASGIRFFKAEKAPIVDEWKQALSNARLTYMESYSTQGGGYSDKIVIELCATGIFRHSKRYQLGLDTGGASASDNKASQGAGSWTVTQDGAGNPILELTFNEGQVQQYSLQYVDEKTLLNGKRYFRTYDARCD